eukprot:g75935.t1
MKRKITISWIFRKSSASHLGHRRQAGFFENTPPVIVSRQAVLLRLFKQEYVYFKVFGTGASTLGNMGLLLAFSLFSLTYAAGCKYPEFPNSCAAIQTTLSASGSTNLAKGEKICIKQSIRIATSPSPVPPQLFRPFVDFLIPDGLDASMVTVKQVGSGGQDIPLVENQEWMRRTLPGMPNPNGIVNATYCGCSAGGLTFPLLCSVDHPYLYRDPEQCPVNEMNLPPDYVVPLPEGYTLIAVKTLSSQLAAGGPLVAVELCNLCVTSDPPANLEVYGRGGFLLGSTLTVSCPADPPKQGQLNNNPSNWQVIAYQQSLVNVTTVLPGGGTPGMGWINKGYVNITIDPGPGGDGPGPNISGCIKYMYAENTAFTGAVVLNGMPICICGDGTPGCGPGCNTGICSATGTFALGCAKTPPFNAAYSSCPNNCTANNMPGQCPSISNTYGPCNDACDCVPLESVCPTCNLSDSPPCDGSSDGGGGVVEFCFPQSYAFSIEFGTIVYTNNGTHLIEGGTYRPTTRTCGFIYTYQNGTSVRVPAVAAEPGACQHPPAQPPPTPAEERPAATRRARAGFSPQLCPAPARGNACLFLKTQPSFRLDYGENQCPATILLSRGGSGARSFLLAPTAAQPRRARREAASAAGRARS